MKAVILREGLKGKVRDVHKTTNSFAGNTNPSFLMALDHQLFWVPLERNDSSASLL
jgi:hypothetical protein